MAARFGDATPTKYYFADNALSKLYFGDTLIWVSFSPTRTDYSTPGTYTFTLPDGSVAIDYAILGGGGGGAGGGLFLPGGAGQGASWLFGTLVRGVDIPMEITQVSVLVGAGGTGGAGGASAGQGSNGGQSALILSSGPSLVAAGGVSAASSGLGSGASGGAARGGNSNSNRDVVLNGQTYSGGATQGSTGAPGNPPGGGGKGAGIGGRGGNGADGFVGLYAR
ncbi:minor tail protein [Mycobacterium phage EagleEye]|uniref:Glycine-rich domain-containing protein n=1 Tax=Mycobacterium phage EagleEye TaxID=1429759 RepID=W0LNS7_9CAUD|nr:minor tail protein [Mycobacterium phage EagleEye]AHG23790.1 hypothetical protein PBI_EAGLEEYE_8 [Mycobacterium phage EagleEye]